MYKIKVGLKSFQTHSIQKCKYQIGRIVHYLKESPASSSMVSEKDCVAERFVSRTFCETKRSATINWKEAGDSFMVPLVRKRNTTLTKRSHLDLPLVKGQLQSPVQGKMSTRKENVAPMSHFAPQNVGEEVVSLSHFAEQNVRKEGFLERESNNAKKVSNHAFGERLCGVLPNKTLNQHKKPTPVKRSFGTTPLPTFVKKMTTLRSPHIDKKSREQFEWKREKAQIHFHLNSVTQISLVLFILTHSRFPGVEIEIGVESKTYFA